MTQNFSELTLNGVWCAYKDFWSAGYSRIIYDKILHVSTNMNDPGIGLNIHSGKKV